MKRRKCSVKKEKGVNLNFELKRRGSEAFNKASPMAPTLV
jgi:hypothetical protein